MFVVPGPRIYNTEYVESEREGTWHCKCYTSVFKMATRWWRIETERNNQIKFVLVLCEQNSSSCSSANTDKVILKFCSRANSCHCHGFIIKQSTD